MTEVLSIQRRRILPPRRYSDISATSESSQHADQTIDPNVHHAQYAQPDAAAAAADAAAAAVKVKISAFRCITILPHTCTMLSITKILQQTALSPGHPAAADDIFDPEETKVHVPSNMAPSNISLEQAATAVAAVESAATFPRVTIHDDIQDEFDDIKDVVVRGQLDEVGLPAKVLAEENVATFLMASSAILQAATDPAIQRSQIATPQDANISGTPIPSATKFAR